MIRAKCIAIDNGWRRWFLISAIMLLAALCTMMAISHHLLKQQQKNENPSAMKSVAGNIDTSLSTDDDGSVENTPTEFA